MLTFVKISNQKCQIKTFESSPGRISAEVFGFDLHGWGVRNLILSKVLWTNFNRLPLTIMEEVGLNKTGCTLAYATKAPLVKAS